MARNLAGTGLPAGNGGVTFPSANEWPITAIPISNIVKGTTTLVTTGIAHGITLSSAQSTPRVDFSQVRGMSQINGQSGYVLAVPSTTQVVVGINSSIFTDYIAPVDKTWEEFDSQQWQQAGIPWSFFTYNLGGFLNITGGSPPDDPLTNLYP